LKQETSGKPVIVAHLVSLEGKKALLAVQVLAPGKVMSGVRIDNVGGVSAKWRSDGREEVPPVIIKDGAAIVAEGKAPVAVKLGDGERLFLLELEDNGALADAATKIRVTVFFEGKLRALCVLNRK
jgi:hypothetical protein